MKIVKFLIGFGLVGASCATSARAISDRVYEPVSLADTEVDYRGTAPQAVQATTADGLVLEGAYWPPDDGMDQVVVVFHGNSYNHLVSAYRAEPLRAGGRGVLIASYRGYGDNPGKPSETGLYADAEAWIAKSRALRPNARIYLFGFSLGGAVALQMAARDEFEAVATLGAFTRLRDMLPPLARPFIRERYDNLETIAKVTEPVLLLHGSADEVVAPKAAVALEEAGGTNVTRINLNGGGHWVPLDNLADRLWAAMEANAAIAGSPAGDGEVAEKAANADHR